MLDQHHFPDRRGSIGGDSDLVKTGAYTRALGVAPVPSHPVFACIEPLTIDQRGHSAPSDIKHRRARGERLVCCRPKDRWGSAV